MLRLWRLYRGGGMGPGHLPDPGGTMDQPCAMLEGFSIMSAAEAQLRPPK